MTSYFHFVCFCQVNATSAAAAAAKMFASKESHKLAHLIEELSSYLAGPALQFVTSQIRMSSRKSRGY